MSAIQQMLLYGEVESDPYWANVVALLHFNGSYVDSKTPATSWTASGGAVITSDPAEVLAGSGSLDCTSSTSDRVSATATALALGTSDFCAEVWFNDTNIGTKNQGIFLLEGVTSQTVRLYGSAAATVTADASGGGPAAPEVSYTLNIWNHAAITRSGSNWTFWLNGVAVKTWTNGTYNGGASTNVWVGSLSGSGSGRQCFLDEFRLTVGVPRYTTPFTPSYPFPDF